MSRLHDHLEAHVSGRIGWLRAAVLGANDGIVSTGSLIVGVAASQPEGNAVMIAGVAALFAGAMSMAAGEYVSVSSQADTEKAELTREAEEQLSQPEFEREELVRIYEERGVNRATAEAVADQMMAKDALATHARDELGLTHLAAARPLQAALTSALTFTAGAAAPLLVAWIAAPSSVVVAVAIASVMCLALLGMLGARAGGAPVVPSIIRVTFWGVLAMLVTYGIGHLFGATVA